MKNFAKILMLVAVLFIGGATVDAKTTKKKAKAKTTYKASNTASSPNWNGNIPTPRFFLALFDDFNKQKSEMRKHGYVYDNLGTDGAFGGEYRKSGVCKIWWGIIPYPMIEVTINDKATYEKVLNELKTYIDSNSERSERYKLIEDMNQMDYYSGKDYTFGIVYRPSYDESNNN